MSIIRLNNLGFTSPSSDIDPSSLTPEVFSNAINFRSIDDKFISSNGKTELYAPAANFSVGNAFFVKPDLDTFYVLLGWDECWVFTGATWSNITPAGIAMSAGMELDWTTTMLGRIPIASNPNFAPVYWSPQNTSQILQPLKFNVSNTWLSLGYSAKSFRAHRNFLFALNLTESGTHFPYSYRWSHPADINGLPPSWDDTDPSYIASKEQLSGAGGDIVDGASIRDAFCIYSQSAISVLDYIGGDFIWQERGLSNSFGLAATNALVEVNGVNYLLTDGDIVVNDGNSIESVLTGKYRRRLASGISSTNYKNSFALHSPNTHEVWFFIVEEGNTYPNIIYIFNYKQSTVALREVSNISCAIYAPKAAADDSHDSGPSGTIDSFTESYDDVGYSPFSYNVLGIGASDSKIYTLTETADDYNTVLERTNYVPENLSGASTILSLYPKIQCNGAVKIQIGSQQHFDGPVTWKPEVLFYPSTQRRVPLRTTGKLHCWRISSVGNSQFKMSGMDIEVVSAGER